MLPKIIARCIEHILIEDRIYIYRRYRIHAGVERKSLLHLYICIYLLYIYIYLSYIYMIFHRPMFSLYNRIYTILYIYTIERTVLLKYLKLS